MSSSNLRFYLKLWIYVPASTVRRKILRPHRTTNSPRALGTVSTKTPLPYGNGHMQDSASKLPLERCLLAIPDRLINCKCSGNLPIMDFLAQNIPISSKPTELPLILGSSSKNRQVILNLARWVHTVLIPDIDEKAIRCDNPYLLPVLIAKAKAAAILGRLNVTGDPFVLLTSDQIVLFGSEIREKPTNEAEAIEFLSSYSNQEVSTISAVVATHYPSGRLVLY